MENFFSARSTPPYPGAVISKLECSYSRLCRTPGMRIRIGAPWTPKNPSLVRWPRLMRACRLLTRWEGPAVNKCAYCTKLRWQAPSFQYHEFYSRSLLRFRYSLRPGREIRGGSRSDG